MSDYVPHKDSSGETTWYPAKIDYYYHMGEAPDGTPIEYTRRTFEIEDIQFNVELPDELFVVKFPANARIYDAVDGFGWIRASELEEMKDALARRGPAGKLVVRWILLGALPLLIVAAIALTARRGRVRRTSG